MPNPLRALAIKPFRSQLWPRLRREAVGLAQDFWHDGKDNPLRRVTAIFGKAKTGAPDAETAKGARAPTAFDRLLERGEVKLPPVPATFWHAEPGELAEIMWGQGFIHAGGAILFERLVSPLVLTSTTAVLNLSAGLGGGLGLLAANGATVTSLESAPQLKARLAGAGVAAFDPAGFTPEPASADILLARELFYRVQDRQGLFTRLATALRPSGQIAFTDYILNAEKRDEPAVQAWRRAAIAAGQDGPPGLIDMAEGWGRAGFRLTTSEDLTAQHKQDLMNGLKKLARHLAQAPRPDAATKRALALELQYLTLTLAALDHGLGYYRFAGARL